MFNVKVDNFNVQFTFQHLTGLEGIEIARKPVQAVTYCSLMVNGKLFEGMAVCSALDKFEKDKGRKLALRRAIDEARSKNDGVDDLPYLVRAAIWERYFNRGVVNQEYFLAAEGNFPEVSGTLDAEYASVREAANSGN